MFSIDIKRQLSATSLSLLLVSVVGFCETLDLDHSEFLIIVHTEKSFWNLIKSIRNQIVFTIFWLIWNQTDSVRLVSNQSEYGKYNEKILIRTKLRIVKIE